MSGLPWMKFYVSDWRGSAKLARCNHELRGIWIEVLCLMHESPQYGVLRWPLKEMARAIGTSAAKLEKLRQLDLLKGAAAGSQCSAYEYTPVSGRTRGPTVTLIPAQQGDIWFCSRMVRDEHVRRAKAGIGAAPDHSPMGGIGECMGAAPDHSPSSRAVAPNQRPEKEKNPLTPGGGSHGAIDTQSPDLSKPPRRQRAKREVETFDAFTARCDAVGEQHIPQHDPVFDYAEKIRLSVEFLELAWFEFARRHSGTRKTQADWRRKFRNAVEGNWFRLWWADGDGWSLTVAGKQAKLAAGPQQRAAA